MTGTSATRCVQQNSGLQNQIPNSYSEIICTVIISEFLTALNALNSSDYPNLAAISQNKTIRSFPVMIDELRQRAIAPAVNILVRGKLKDRVCAGVNTIFGLGVINMLAAILDNLNSPRDVPNCE
jgi:hypothetical protein